MTKVSKNANVAANAASAVENEVINNVAENGAENAQEKVTTQDEITRLKNQIKEMQEKAKLLAQAERNVKAKLAEEAKAAKEKAEKEAKEAAEKAAAEAAENAKIELETLVANCLGVLDGKFATGFELKTAMLKVFENVTKPAGTKTPRVRNITAKVAGETTPRTTSSSTILKEACAEGPKTLTELIAILAVHFPEREERLLKNAVRFYCTKGTDGTYTF